MTENKDKETSIISGGEAQIIRINTFLATISECNIDLSGTASGYKPRSTREKLNCHLKFDCLFSLCEELIDYQTDAEEKEMKVLGNY